MPNQLAQETSPYLLQHADNPVDWRSWGPEAFAEAKRLDKPVLLSVGYAACHWCHVMAHESFETPAVAQLMNRLFVNIKVDREERPDIDAIYQHSLAMLGEQGGWPLTMFLTPDAKPYWGGTYFPPEQRYGRPGFPTVLQRMADEHYITPQQAATANASPIVLKGQPQPEKSIAPFYLEEVRKHLEREYGAKALYESGLAVTTTLDPALQRLANRAIEKGLRDYDKRHGWRKAVRTVAGARQTVESYKDERWKGPIRVGDVVPAVVEAVGKPAPATGARLVIGGYHADLGRDGFAWTRKASAADLVNVGDIVDVQIKTLDDETKTATVSLEQTPLAEAAMVVLDNHTGEVKAMVGGWDFQRSKFNRAVQAYRQLGSTFKPVVYTAAIDRGYTPASVIIDSPVSYPSGNGGTWSPQNYDHTFMGPITLRYALEESRNIPAIKVMAEVGVKTVLDYAKRFGFGKEFPPYLPIALGAGDATLMEVTSAYTTFPNQGIRMKPWTLLNVKDREGNLLEQNRPEPADVIAALRDL